MVPYSSNVWKKKREHHTETSWKKNLARGAGNLSQKEKLLTWKRKPRRQQARSEKGTCEQRLADCVLQQVFYHQQKFGSLRQSKGTIQRGTSHCSKKTNTKTHKNNNTHNQSQNAAAGSTASVLKASPCKKWGSVWTTQRRPDLWWTAPPFKVRAIHASSPPDLTASAEPHPRARIMIRAVFFVEFQAWWISRDNSDRSHCICPVRLLPKQKNECNGDDAPVRVQLHHFEWSQSTLLRL